MLKKVTFGVAALAAMGFASSAMAANIYLPDPATVDLDVVVEEIAVLEVVKATGSMTIDDHQDSLQGQPSSGASVFNAVTGDYATMRLNTNFDVDAISISYPKVDGIRGFGAGFYFGEAVGDLGQTLGVWPQAGIVDEATNEIIGGGGGMIGNDSSSEIAPLLRTNTGGGAFGAGTHLIALGLSTNWSRTLETESMFAAPDTYSIELTATIVP